MEEFITIGWLSKLADKPIVCECGPVSLQTRSHNS